jgi:hypothetical protein
VETPRKSDRKLCSNKFTWCFHKQNYYRNSLVEQNNYSASENFPQLGNNDNLDFLQSLKRFRVGHLNIASL